MGAGLRSRRSAPLVDVEADGGLVQTIRARRDGPIGDVRELAPHGFESHGVLVVLPVFVCPHVQSSAAAVMATACIGCSPVGNGE